MKKGIRDTILSLLSIVLVFFFLMLLGNRLGIGSSTDIYFLSVMVIAYLNQLVQSVWDAMQPYYIELKIENPQKSHQLYSTLINMIALFSIAIISLYFLTLEYITLLSIQQKEFLNIYIFIVFFQNILIFNKKILNLEHHYASYYLVDIFIYSLNIVALLWFYNGNLQLIAYTMIVATAVATVWQFYLIFKKTSIFYSFQLYHPKSREIVKNSIKMKISGMLYDLKEPLFALIFLTLGEGLFSLYNYAYKFSAAIFQVTNTPSINRYLTNINHVVAQKKYQEIEPLIQKILFETLPFFIISSVIFYFIMPLFLELTFGDKLDGSSIQTLQTLFIYISFFYLVIVLETPYSNNIGVFKLFNYHIFVNMIFSVFMLSIYFIFKHFSLEYMVYLNILIVAQLSNFILFFYKNLFYIRRKR